MYSSGDTMNAKESKSATAPSALPDVLPLILRVGLIAGTLDIADALIS